MIRFCKFIKTKNIIVDFSLGNVLILIIFRWFLKQELDKSLLQKTTVNNNESSNKKKMIIDSNLYHFRQSCLAFQGTLVNQTCHFMIGGSPEPMFIFFETYIFNDIVRNVCII